jgi:dihydroorotate dehydrogenase (fumarate)
MNLETSYLGLKLSSPFVVGASPFCDDLHVARQLQDAGASALVMRSLFEEQIEAEQRALSHHLAAGAESQAEANSYFPRYAEYQLQPDNYLRQIEGLKRNLSIPVIASLNGSHPGGWTDHAARFEAVGADAIELNLYHLATDVDRDAEDIETEMLETVNLVTTAVRIPVAVKVSPFHTAPVHFAAALERVGASGLVLFNRFYQPDINLEQLEVQPKLTLSDPSELLLRLRWLAIIAPRVQCSLAASGGVHGMEDVAKAILSGADVVQLVSVLLRHGPGYLRTLKDSLVRWMTEHEYTALAEMQGAMDLRHCPDPEAFERANYQRILQSWRV